MHNKMRKIFVLMLAGSIAMSMSAAYALNGSEEGASLTPTPTGNEAIQTGGTTGGNTGTGSTGTGSVTPTTGGTGSGQTTGTPTGDNSGNAGNGGNGGNSGDVSGTTGGNHDSKSEGEQTGDNKDSGKTGTDVDDENKGTGSDVSGDSKSETKTPTESKPAASAAASTSAATAAAIANNEANSTPQRAVAVEAATGISTSLPHVTNGAVIRTYRPDGESRLAQYTASTYEDFGVAVKHAIKTAPKKGTVLIATDKWFTLDKDAVNALKKHKQVKLVIRYDTSVDNSTVDVLGYDATYTGDTCALIKVPAGKGKVIEKMENKLNEHRVSFKDLGEKFNVEGIAAVYE